LICYDSASVIQPFSIDGRDSDMIWDVRPGTRKRGWVLFDPAAVQALTRPGAFDASGAERAAEAGDMLHATVTTKGYRRVKICVDEEPAEDCTAHAVRPLKDAIIKIPSGRLFCLGVEYMPAPDGTDLQPKYYEPEMSYRGGSKDIRPGNYALSGFDIDWDSDERDQRVAQALGAEDSANHRTFKRRGMMLAIGTWMGLPAMAGLFVATMYLAQYGWPAILPQIVGVFCTMAVIAGTVWAGRRLNTPVASRLRMRMDEAQATCPDTVLVLKRLPDDATDAEYGPSRMGVVAGDKI
jgi:hypothetical protein